MAQFWFSPPTPVSLQHVRGSLIPTPQLVLDGEFHTLFFYPGEPVFNTENCIVVESTREKSSFKRPDDGGMYTYYIDLGRTEIFFPGFGSKYARDETGEVYMRFEDGGEYERRLNRRGEWTERIDYADGQTLTLCDGRLEVDSGHRVEKSATPPGPQ